MDLIAFRNLTELGYNEDEINAIAAEYEVTDGPDEEGEMFDRPARPSDYFPAPFPTSRRLLHRMAVLFRLTCRWSPRPASADPITSTLC